MHFFEILTRTRMVKKNLLYIIGVPLGFKKILSELYSDQFFGHYGEVESICVIKDNKQSGRKKPEKFINLYVTYKDELSSTLALICLSKFRINKKLLRVSFGRT